MAASPNVFDQLAGQEPPKKKVQVRPLAAQKVRNVFDEVAEEEGGNVFDQVIAEENRATADQATPTATIGARKGVTAYLEDVQSDIRYGTGATLPGRILRKMGAPGTSVGVSEEAGEYAGGPVLGPVRALTGITRPFSEEGKRPLHRKILAGANELVGGLLQAAMPFMGATSPGLLAYLPPFMAATKGLEKLVEPSSLSPEAKEFVAGTVPILAAGAGGLVLKGRAARLAKRPVPVAAQPAPPAEAAAPPEGLLNRPPEGAPLAPPRPIEPPKVEPPPIAPPEVTAKPDVFDQAAAPRTVSQITAEMAALEKKLARTKAAPIQATLRGQMDALAAEKKSAIQRAVEINTERDRIESERYQQGEAARIAEAEASPEAAARRQRTEEIAAQNARQQEAFATERARPFEAPKPTGPVAQTYAPDVLEDAGGLVGETLGKLGSLEKPGVYWSDTAMTLPGEAAGREGSKPFIYGIKSHFGDFPWLKEVKTTLKEAEAAIGKGKGALYERLMHAAAKEITRQREAAKPIVAEYVPELQRLAQETKGVDPNLSSLLTDLAEGRTSVESKRLRDYIKERINEAESAAQFSRAVDDLSRSTEPIEPLAGARGEGRPPEEPPTREQPPAVAREILPGMEEAIARQKEAAGAFQGEKLTAELRAPLTKPQGEIEKSPLFRGTEAVPQKEMFAPSATAIPAAKEPWQMTREELNRTGYIAHDIKTDKDFVKPSRAINEAANASEHRRVVAKAVAANKPVPPEVLAQYPELAPKAAVPTAFNQTEAFEMGKKAFAAGTVRAPAMNTDLDARLNTIKDTGDRIAILKAYTRGWDKANLVKPAAKEPWQKTQEEAVQTYPFGKDVPKAPEGATANLNGQPAVKRNGSWTYTNEQMGELRVTDPKTAAQLDHQVLIKEAVAAGKPVPAEVLAEYPDLAMPSATVEKVAFPAELARRLLDLPYEQRVYPMGDHNATLRQDVLEAITGTRPKISKAGATAVRRGLLDHFRISTEGKGKSVV